MNKRIKEFGLLLAGLFLATLTALATDYTWTGGGDGVTWESPANWGKSAEGAYPKSSSDKAIFAANTTATVVLANDLTLSALNLKDSTTVTLKSAGDERVSLMLNGAEFANKALNLTLDHIAVTRLGDYALTASSAITLKNGAELLIKTLTAVNNNTLSLSGQSSLRVQDLKMKDGTTVTIDNSTLTTTANAYLGSAAPGGGRMVFKGSNPMFQCYGSNCRADSATTAYATPFDFDFEIPLGGYKAPPIQTVDATAFASKMQFRFNVLETSPALTAGTRLVLPVMNAKGITSAYVTAPTEGQVALSYAKFDGSEATKDADRNILCLTLNPSSEVEQPTSVRDRAVLVDSVVTSVSRREIKLTFEIGACATDGTTTRVTAEGALDGESVVFTDGSSTTVTTPKRYVTLISWSSPKLTFGPCLVRLRLEQLNAQGEVVAMFYSRVYSATTVANATYTWQAVDGNWDGDLDDRAHWACSVTDPDDRYDYPQDFAASACFPKDCVAKITVPRSMTLGIIKLTGDGADVTITPKGGDTSILLNATKINNETRTAEAKITFENMNLKFENNETDVGAYNTAVFRNCNLTWATSTNVRRNNSRMVFENCTSTMAAIRVGGAGSCVVISNTYFACSSVCLGNSVVGGKIRFEGENPVLYSSGKDFRADINNNATVLEFLIPENGYRELPIQIPGNPSSFFPIDNSKSGTSYTIRIAPESPIFNSYFDGVVPLVDWWTKGIDLTRNLIFDLGERKGAEFVFSKSSAYAGDAYDWVAKSEAGTNPKAMGVRIVGIPPNNDAVAVTAEPDEIGSPIPGYGVQTDGISAGAEKTFSFPQYEADGVAYVATGWAVWAFDPETVSWLPRSSGDGNSCAYKHPDPSTATRLTWQLKRQHVVTAKACGKGSVDIARTQVDVGADVTLTATAGEGAAFVGWYDETGARVSTEPAVTVAAVTPKAMAALFVEWGKPLPCYSEVGDYRPLILRAIEQAGGTGVIQLEAGVYPLGDSLVLDGDVTLRGTADDRTVLKAVYVRNVGESDPNWRSPLVLRNGATAEHLAITGGNAQGLWGARGGGVSIYSGTLAHCFVTNNYYKGSGNSMGQGIYVYSKDSTDSATITHCVIADNIVDVGGGNPVPGAGIYIAGSGKVLVDNCLIVRNDSICTASKTSGPGGGIWTSGSNVTIANCTIVGNHTTYRGGGIYVENNKPKIANCIIAGNTADADACVSGPDVSAKTLTADNALDTQVANLCTNNLVGAGVTAFGVGGLSGDPVFKSDSYHLKVGSPAIGKGMVIPGVTDVPDLDGVARTEAIDLGCYAYVPSVDFDLTVTIDALVAFNDQPIGVTVDYINPPIGVELENVYSITDGETEWPVVFTDGRVVITRPGTWRLKVTVMSNGKPLASSQSATSVRVGVHKAYVTASAEGEAVYPYATEETAAKCLNDVESLCIDGTEIVLDEGTHVLRQIFTITDAVRVTGAGVDRTILDGCDDSSHRMFFVNNAGCVLENFTVTRLYVMDFSGIFISSLGGTVRNVHFTNIGAKYTGFNVNGVCVNLESASALVENCRFDNISRDDGAGNLNITYGLAVKITSGTVRNCLFAKSTVVSGARSANDTAGLVWAGASAVVENCTFVGNTLKGYKPGEGQPGAWATQLYAANGATIRNVLVGAPKIELGEGADDSLLYTVRFDNDKKNVSNCCVEGEETYGANPADGTKICFSETEPGHIKVPSSCRNAGANQAWMETAKDLDGNPRRFGRRVDIGCFELQEGPGLMIIVE